MLPPDLRLRLVETWDDACDFKRWLGERRSVLGLDTETTGLSWFNDRLRLVQFGDKQAGWALAWDDWRGLIREAIEKYDEDIALHNSKFDLHFLEQGGVKVPRHLVHDTQTLAHIISPTERVALKEVARRLVDPNAAAGQDELKKAMARAKWDWETLPVDYEGYWIYSALDPVLTAYIYDELHPKVITGYRELYDIEMASLFVIIDMERRGVRVDVEYCEQKQAELIKFAADARAWLADEYGVKSLGTKALAAEFLRLGVKLTKKTPTGGWSMDEEALSAIDHPLAETVLEIRKAEKIAKAYFENILDSRDENDYVHPSIRHVGARTGRMSVTNPALQTLPRGPLVRNAFIPSEGNLMLSIDYEQIEARLATHFSEDEGLRDAFLSGHDFFTAIARQIYQDDDLHKEDPRRQITKNAVYAKLYGAGLDQFAHTAKVTTEEAAGFLDMFDRTFPKVRAMQRRIEHDAKLALARDGEPSIRTPLGRRLVAEEGREYKLVNALIQGTAADLLKQVIVELDAAGLADHLVLPVHDELIFDVPAEDVEEVRDEVVRIMRREDWLVPLEVDPHIGERWGALK